MLVGGWGLLLAWECFLALSHMLEVGEWGFEWEVMGIWGLFLV